MQWYQSIFCEALNWRQPSLPDEWFQRCYFPSTLKSLQRCHQQHWNRVWHALTAVLMQQANQDSREKLFNSVKHLWCTREYSKHWEYQDNTQTWSIPSNTRNDWAYQESRLSFPPKTQRNIKVSSLSDFFVCTCVCKTRVFLYGAALISETGWGLLIEHKTHQLTIMPSERAWLASLEDPLSLPPPLGF